MKWIDIFCIFVCPAFGLIVFIINIFAIYHKPKNTMENKYFKNQQEPTLQEMIAMPLLASCSLCIGRILRVPGGWLIDRNFVPEIVVNEIFTIDTYKRTVSVPLNKQTEVAYFFAKINFREVDRVATGGMMSQPEILITYGGNKSDFDEAGFVKLCVDLSINS